MKLISLLVMWLAAMSALCNIVLWAFVVGRNDKDVMLCFGSSVSLFNVTMLLAAIANAAIVLLYLLEWNC